jgi:hypothetical protein
MPTGPGPQRHREATGDPVRLDHLALPKIPHAQKPPLNEGTRDRETGKDPGDVPGTPAETGPTRPAVLVQPYGLARTTRTS